MPLRQPLSIDRARTVPADPETSATSVRRFMWPKSQGGHDAFAEALRDRVWVHYFGQRCRDLEIPRARFRARPGLHSRDPRTLLVDPVRRLSRVRTGVPWPSTWWRHLEGGPPTAAGQELKWTCSARTTSCSAVAQHLFSGQCAGSTRVTVTRWPSRLDSASRSTPAIYRFPSAVRGRTSHLLRDDDATHHQRPQGGDVT